MLIFFIGAVNASDINDSSVLADDNSDSASLSVATFTDLKNNITNSKNELNVIEKFNQFKYHYILICILFIYLALFHFFLQKILIGTVH